MLDCQGVRSSDKNPNFSLGEGVSFGLIDPIFSGKVNHFGTQSPSGNESPGG